MYASLVFQDSLHELGRVCATRQVLPKSCALSDTPLDVTLPSASGDAYGGTLNGSKGRVKRVNANNEGDPQKVKEVRSRHHDLPCL